MIPATFGELPPSIRDNVVPSTCLEWAGRRSEKGYGLIWIDGRQQRAHRVVYERLVGPIPEGLVIDHLCRNRACVNPDHMEPVTIWENTLRGQNFMATGVIPRRPKKSPPPLKTECNHGHALTSENTYTDPAGRRFCRTCRRVSHIRDASRKRAVRAARLDTT